MRHHTLHSFGVLYVLYLHVAHYLDAISESDARKGLELHGLIKMVRSAILLVITLSLSKFASHVSGSIHYDSFIIEVAQWLYS